MTEQNSERGAGNQAGAPLGVHLVPPEVRQAMQDEILTLFDLKPWHIGAAPIPWHVRIWHTITLARLRARLATWREQRHEPDWES